jgi:hypothetical protein
LALLRYQTDKFLVPGFENFPAVRQHSGIGGPMVVAPIVTRVWDYFFENRSAWLIAMAGPKRPRSFLAWLRGPVWLAIRDEFGIEPITRGRGGREVKLGRTHSDAQPVDGRIWQARGDRSRGGASPVGKHDGDALRSDTLLASSIDADQSELQADVEKILKLKDDAHPKVAAALDLIFNGGKAGGCTVPQAALLTQTPLSTLTSRLNAFGILCNQAQPASETVRYLVRTRRGQKRRAA